MRKLILTATSAVALLGLAACGDGDENPAQSTQPAAGTTQQVPVGNAPAASGTNGAATEAVQTRPSSSTGGPAPGGATGD
jgi:predicted small lipoprotein YifL